MSVTLDPVSEDFGSSGLQVPPVNAQPLSDEEMQRVRFGRSRLLKRVSGLVFGYSIASAIDASSVLACTTGAPPPCCGPSNACCCYNLYSGCCDPGCTDRYSGCGPSGYGWYYCCNGTYIFCHDYWSGGDKCICRFVLSSC